jgi:5'-methylthioinosine phosphorylase
MFAVLGGSGFNSWSELRDSRKVRISTPYGMPSDALTLGSVAGVPCVFLARHGDGHAIPPHQINYRANIWALKESGVSWIVSIATVGGITKGFEPGVLAAPHQLIDYTWGRRQTFFDDGEAVNHVDFTEPYSPGRREQILHAAQRVSEPIIDRAIYAVTQGPRLETAAEIDKLEKDGANIVGMTAMPEAVLARELGLEYAAITAVANHAAGRGDSRLRIDLGAIQAVHATAMDRVSKIIMALAQGSA